jgi:hypothetical protein
MSASVQLSAAVEAMTSEKEEEQMVLHDAEKGSNVLPTGANPSVGRDDAGGPAPLEKWNEPRINMWRFFATLFSFIIMGMNDGAIGVSDLFL